MILSENVILGFSSAKRWLTDAVYLRRARGALARGALPVCPRGPAVSGNRLDFKTQPSPASVFSAVK